MKKTDKRPTIELTSEEYGQLKKQIIENGLIPMTKKRHDQLLSAIANLELTINKMKDRANSIIINVNKIDQSGNVICEGNNEIANLVEECERLKAKEANAVIVIGEFDEKINIDSIFVAEINYGDEQETAIFKLVANHANACSEEYTEISMDLSLGRAVFGKQKNDEFEVPEANIKGKIIDVQNDKEEILEEKGYSLVKVPCNSGNNI